MTTKKTGRGGHRTGAGRKPQGKAARVTTSINIDPTLLAKLDALVAKEGGSRSTIINTLIKDYTDKF